MLTNRNIFSNLDKYWMENLTTIKKQYIVNYLKIVPYSIFWASLMLYSLGYLLYTTRSISDKICIVIITMGIIGIVASTIFLVNFQIRNKYFRFVFPIYMISNFYVFIQAFNNLNFEKILSFITNPYLFFPYLIPLLVLVPANVFFLKKIFEYFTYLGLVLIILCLFFMNYMFKSNSLFAEHAIWTLGSGCGFLLLTYEYHNNKNRILAILVVLLSLFISTVLARRNIMLTFSNYIFFSIILLLFNSGKSVLFKILVLLIVFSTFLSAYFIFDRYQNDLFSRISGRIDENTREQIFTGFFLSMSTDDLILGKGFDGTYYAPTIEEGVDNRSIIECGYLQIILKGGIVNLALFLLIALPSAIKGILKSHNTISKAAGLIILLWLIDMFPWGMPALNIRYIFIWICIGICYSKEICNLSDAEIKASFKLFST